MGVRAFASEWFASGEASALGSKLPAGSTAERERSGITSRGRWASGVWGALGLLAICLAVYVPGLFTLPPVDRDESRFAQASRQMLESGDYAVPRVQDRPRLNKPALIYWLQCAAVGIVGDEGRANAGIWVYRLVSVGCAIGSVLLTWRLGLRLFDPRAAWLGAVFLAVSPMVVWDAHQARADQLLLFTVVLTQYCLWRVIMSARRAGDGRRGSLLWAIGFWFALAAGVMSKGPITPMVAALTAAGFCAIRGSWRWLGELRPLLGVAIVTGVVGPWVYSVASSVGFDQYLSIIREETIGRSAGAKEGHWGPPGYHLVLSAVLLWPGSLFTAAGVVRAWGRGRVTKAIRSWFRVKQSGRGGEVFLLAWALPSWIVFELVSTKLPHYTMPLYPALALLSARMMLHAASRGRRFSRDLGHRLGEAAWLAIGLVVGAMPVVILLLLDRIGAESEAWRGTAIVMPLVAAALMVVAARAMRRGRFAVAQCCGIMIAVLTPLVLIEGVMARSGALNVSGQVMERVRSIDPSGARPFASVGYHEDSLVFLSRGRLEKIDEEHAIEWMARNPDGVLVLPGAVAQSLGLRGAGNATGFNYSTGRRVTLDVIDLFARGTAGE